MQELIVNIAPNLASKLPDFYKALGDTMLMVLWSGLISFVFGLLLGVVLTVTKPNGILENKVVYQILDKLVSLFRSIPFIILLTWVMPITRALVGTVLYVRGAIVPLVFGSVPFFTRQVESALAELDGGLIEAALSMGSSPLEIIFRVYLKESIAAIARGTTITIVSLLNLTAMAGVAGAGGLGDFAIRYGHDRNMADITNVTVLVLVLIVCVIEFAGGRIVKKNTHYRDPHTVPTHPIIKNYFNGGYFHEAQKVLCPRPCSRHARPRADRLRLQGRRLRRQRRCQHRQSDRRDRDRQARRGRRHL